MTTFETSPEITPTDTTAPEADVAPPAAAEPTAAPPTPVPEFQGILFGFFHDATDVQMFKRGLALGVGLVLFFIATAFVMGMRIGS